MTSRIHTQSPSTYSSNVIKWISDDVNQFDWNSPALPPVFANREALFRDANVQ